MSKGERLCSIAILFFAIGACGSAQPNPRQIDGRAPVAPPYSSSPCPQGNEYKDGCSDAAAGLTLFPNTLDSYKSAPPWNVAGVHFAVGVPAHHPLKDPTVSPPPTGCVLGDTSLTCAGTLTLDGYDFSLHGGTTLVVTGGNVTVRNCLFIVGPNQGALGKIVDVSGAADATFINNEFDGANIPVTPQRGQTVSIASVGKITFQYNYFHDSGGDMIDFSGGPQVNIVQYNLFKDIGLKTPHSDTLQWCGSILSNSDFSFNTINQTRPGLSGMGLLTMTSECTGAKISNVLVHNNTLISKARDNFGAGATVAQGAGPAFADHVAIFDNYLDPSGIMSFTASPWFPTGYYHSTLPRPSALHSLWDMRTGSPILVPSKWKRGSVFSDSFYVYPDASGYTPALSDVYSIIASPLSGTAASGDAITFTLEMDEPWLVTGAPKLLLSSGGTADYIKGSGTAALTFTYIVGNGETAKSVAIIAIDLNGGSIRDASGNRANMDGVITTFSSLSIR
jgi:hypothetical protein